MTKKAYEKGRKILAATGAEALFVTAEHWKRYLTGFLTEDGFVIVDKDGTTLYTDKRYLEAAKARLLGKIFVKEMDKDTKVEDVLSKYKTVAVPYKYTTMRTAFLVKDSGANVVDADVALERSASVKTDEEIGYIKAACKIADEAIQALLPKIKEGQTERQVASMLEDLMRQKGADGTSFDTIVAFGKHSAVPHHETGDTKLQFGDVVLIDFGCKVKGYCSDMTRTFLYGDDGKKEDFKKSYQAVLSAHEKVKAEVHAGMKGRDADSVARDYLHSLGYGKYFTHSLGHGIGLQIHEAPTISPSSAYVLEDGMVFSDEPGVYFEGEYGIRIEDTVMLSGGKIESLMTTEKSLIIL